MASKNDKREELEMTQLIGDQGTECDWDAYAVKNDDGTYKLKRENGTGPYRIDEPLDRGLREDLYSLIFATTIRPEYVLHYKKKHEQKQ